jgi:signal transduction histidine kinase
MSSRQARRLSAGVLALAFAAVGLVLSASAGIAIGIGRSTQRRVDDIVNNALVSVELLGRMAVDVDAEEKLVAEHILEMSGERMAELERRIEAARADYAAAAHSYEPLVTYPNESEAWHRLRDDVRGREGPLAEALRLSRLNRDTEAQKIMLGLGPLFEAIGRDVATSIAINEGSARAAQGAARRLQRDAAVWELLSWCLGVLITIAIGVVVTRQFARAQRRERQAFAVLEERNRELDAFAGRVAHDFRAPLAAVRLSATSLTLPEADLNRSVAAIDRSIGRMTAMIDDLLQLSNIDGGARADVCDPAVAAAAVRENLEERVVAAEASMELQVAPARVRCRDGLCQQVLGNLAENALKYTREGVRPEVRISGAVVSGLYELRVVDNGIGLSAEEVARVFDPLFRARRMRGVQGTGLGLSIVKRIVEAYGGSATVESKLGHGSTFVIRLPLA